jgi:hypothetical protein
MNLGVDRAVHLAGHRNGHHARWQHDRRTWTRSA